MTAAWVVRYPDGRMFVMTGDRQVAEKLLQPGYTLDWEENPNG